MGSRKNLRIAMFFSSNPSSTGGVQEHVLYLSRQLRKMGHAVTIFGPEGKSGMYQGYRTIGYTIQLPLPNGNWASVQMSKPFKDVNDMLNRDSFDVLHIQEPYIPFLAWQLIQQIDMPKVSTFHSAWDNDSVVNAINNVLPMFKEKFSENMQEAIFVSRITKKRWKGLCTKNVSQHVIYNAVDAEAFRPRERRDDGTVRLLFLGRIVARKGVKYLLNAFKAVAPLYPNVRLDIVGGGAEAEYTQQFIKRNGLGKQVAYRGEIFGLKRVPYFQNADIFCAPYFDEANPLTILEAMSCGCTIVGFDNEAMKESLARYPSPELIVKQRDTQALIRALKKAIENAQLRQNTRAWCIRESRKYQWSTVAKETERVYLKAMQKYYA